jgi:hypothetical protein
MVSFLLSANKKKTGQNSNNAYYQSYMSDGHFHSGVAANGEGIAGSTGILCYSSMVFVPLFISDLQLKGSTKPVLRQYGVMRCF